MTQAPPYFLVSYRFASLYLAKGLLDRRSFLGRFRFIVNGRAPQGVRQRVFTQSTQEFEKSPSGLDFCFGQFVDQPVKLFLRRHDLVSK